MFNTVFKISLLMKKIIEMFLYTIIYTKKMKTENKEKNIVSIMNIENNSKHNMKILIKKYHPIIII